MNSHTEEILVAIAHELRYMLSYGVFNPGQYIFSRYCVDADTPSCLWYCAVRVSGSVLTLVLTDEQYCRLDLSEPSSIGELERHLKVRANWYPAGSSTELKILSHRRDQEALEDLMASLGES